MKMRKPLVLITFFVSLVVIVCLTFYTIYYASLPFVFDEKGSIILGHKEAPVELILFEDFQCGHCQEFSERVLPRLQERYINSGVVRCVLIPLPLFPGSRALTNTALAIYHDSPDSVLPFLRDSYRQFPSNPVTESALLDLVEKTGGIDIEDVEACMKEHCYYSNINKNLKKARNLMKKQVQVPMLYINGVPVSSLSYDVIAARIEKILR